jgi:uroporphyrinogen decarboxylase
MVAAMTHRERVIAALSHQEPDTVPIDFASTRDSSIVVEGYEQLKEHFGIQAENALTSRMMRVVDVDERILRALDTDTRGVFPATPPDVILSEGRYRDEWGVERVRPPGSFYYDERSFPLAGDITMGDILHYPWPDPQHPIRRTGLKERVRQIRDATDCAVVLNLQSAFVHTSQYLRGFEDWFMDFARDRRLLGALFDAVLDVSMAINRELLEEVGAEVDVVMGSDDLGLQGGLMISPQAYRELIKPRHQRYFQLMHELSPAKVFFHTCGSVADILGDLVEIGVEVLHPVQVSAAGMAPARLKEHWGEKLAFWGAIDTQHVLPYGSVKDVKAEVERRIEEFGQGGGYVLGAVHNLQPDVPTQNILAMYRHAREYLPSYGV